MTKDEMIEQQAAIIAQQQKMIEELQRGVAELKEKVEQELQQQFQATVNRWPGKTENRQSSQTNREEGWCAKGTCRAGVNADSASYGNSEP